MNSTTHLDQETHTINLLSALEATGDLPCGSLLLLVGDEHARLMLPVAIDDVPDDPAQDERNDVLRSFRDTLCRVDHFGGLLLAVGRDGDPKPRGSDYAWHDALVQGLEGSGLVAYGTYVVTPFGVRRVRPQLAQPECLAA